MAKFLIIVKTTKPIPSNADIKGSILHWKELEKSGKAEVYAIGGLEGFVALVEVNNHEELMEILQTNPVCLWGEFQVVPLTSAEAEERILHNLGRI